MTVLQQDESMIVKLKTFYCPTHYVDLRGPPRHGDEGVCCHLQGHFARKQSQCSTSTWVIMPIAGSLCIVQSSTRTVERASTVHSNRWGASNALRPQSRACAAVRARVRVRVETSAASTLLRTRYPSVCHAQPCVAMPSPFVT